MNPECGGRSQGALLAPHSLPRFSTSRIQLPCQLSPDGQAEIAGNRSSGAVRGQATEPGASGAAVRSGAARSLQADGTKAPGAANFPEPLLQQGLRPGKMAGDVRQGGMPQLRIAPVPGACLRIERCDCFSFAVRYCCRSP